MIKTENKQTQDIDCDANKNKWSLPEITFLTINKTLSNFNDTIVDNETGSSGS